MLNAMRPPKDSPDAFIFRSKKGGIIDFGDFLNHAWKGYKNRHGREIDGLVTKLVKQGIVSKYRRPYQCRHTFIIVNSAKRSGFSSLAIAVQPMSK